MDRLGRSISPANRLSRSNVTSFETISTNLLSQKSKKSTSSLKSTWEQGIFKQNCSVFAISCHQQDAFPQVEIPKLSREEVWLIASFVFTSNPSDPERLRIARFERWPIENSPLSISLTPPNSIHKVIEWFRCCAFSIWRRKVCFRALLDAVKVTAADLSDWHKQKSDE